MESLLQDLRYGLRMLGRNPVFTIVAVSTLALGIGVNTGIFSVVQAVLLRPLPYPDSEQLVQIWEASLSQGQSRKPVSPYNSVDWQNQSSSFEQLSAYQNESFIITGSGSPEQVKGALVSANILQTLKVTPILGRAFLQEGDQSGGNRVVIIGHGCWVRRFNSNPEVINEKIILNGEPFTIIGVMPPDFQFPRPEAELWTPPAFSLKGITRGSRFINAVGRLKPGIALQQAQAEMDTIAQQLSQRYPDANRDDSVTMMRLQEPVVGRIRPVLLILWCAVTLVLLIASINVANLLMVRASAREKEISIRTALGASHRRLVQQFLTEGLLLVIIGSASGLVLAYWETKLLLNYAGQVIPRANSTSIDASVLAYTLLISFVIGVVFGLMPAFGYPKQLPASLKGAGSQTLSNPGKSGLRMALVSLEIAVALMLLIGAGLLMKSFLRLQQIDPGFDPAGVMTMEISLPEFNYPKSA